MSLRDFLSSTWDHIQDNLFPWLREELGPLTDLHKRVIGWRVSRRWWASGVDCRAGRQAIERRWRVHSWPKP